MWLYIGIRPSEKKGIELFRFDDGKINRVGNAAINLGVRYDYSKGLFQALPFLDAFGNATGRMSAAFTVAQTYLPMIPKASNRNIIELRF